jgi:hypothetical protein
MILPSPDEVVLRHDRIERPEGRRREHRAASAGAGARAHAIVSP